MPLNWLLTGAGSGYVYDITALAPTQIMLGMSWPGDGSVNTAAQADAIAAAFLAAITGLPAVSAAVQNPLRVNGQLWQVVSQTGALPAALTFPAAAWNNYAGGFASPSVYTGLKNAGTPAVSLAGFLSRSPIDGILTAANITTLISALQAAVLAQTGAMVSITQQVLTPATAI